MSDINPASLASVINIALSAVTAFLLLVAWASRRQMSRLMLAGAGLAVVIAVLAPSTRVPDTMRAEATGEDLAIAFRDPSEGNHGSRPITPRASAACCFRDGSGGHCQHQH